MEFGEMQQTSAPVSPYAERLAIALHSPMAMIQPILEKIVFCTPADHTPTAIIMDIPIATPLRKQLQLQQHELQQLQLQQHELQQLQLQQQH